VNLLRANSDTVIDTVTNEGGRAERGLVAAAALRIEGLDAPFRSPSFVGGLWTAQDEAAQLVGELVEPRPGETIVDACAGVGGKSTHLAALSEDRARVISVDVSADKLRRLEEACSRLGVTCCSPRQADLRRPEALGSISADRVLLDAPCSGLGVLRRHPELKWRATSPDRVAELVQLQRELLATAVGALRPDGLLVYSVCTTTPEEGPEQVQWLLSQFPHLRLELPPPGTAGDVASHGLRLWPHRHGTDGFFIARLRSLPR
jgi:16S rRNA (cytosine967-C5)-methyltransferase